MRKVKSEGLAEYLAETRGLERDYIGELLKSRSVAWRIAAVSLTIAVVSVGAVMALTPLKQTEVAVVRLDEATGNAQVMTTLADAKTSYGETVDRYFLNQYVLNRESYDYDTIQHTYDTTALLTAPAAQPEFFKIYDGAEGRHNVLKNSARILVKVKSITPDPKLGTAVVRFQTQKQRPDYSTEPAEHWIATIGYGYVNAATSEADRRINPLGFQVRSYRVDAELVGSQ